MFSTVRRFIKTAILFLFVGLAYGASLLYRSLILGVALWLFPRPAKHDERYRPERIRLAWWILAPATATRFVAEAAGPGAAGGWLGWTILIAGLAQIAGLALYFYTMWPRIRPVGSHLREDKGEKF